MLLIIAMLATLIAYLTGFVAENNLWHYYLQANTCRNKRTLSLFYLGCRILKKKFKRKIDYDKAMINLQLEISYAG